MMAINEARSHCGHCGHLKRCCWCGKDWPQYSSSFVSALKHLDREPKPSEKP